jgi:hypothetical protein
MKKKDVKILIVGHGRHGKDTLASIINLELGFKFRGSSEVAAKEVIYPLMKNFYSSAEDAFENRHENRELWRAVISDFNREDPTRLCKLVCKGGHGYTGLRDKVEVISAIKGGFFTHVIWVRRPELKEDDTTMTFGLDTLKDLNKRGFLRNLAIVENHTEEVLVDVVQNELRKFLSEYAPSPICLNINRDSLITES